MVIKYFKKLYRNYKEKKRIKREARLKQEKEDKYISGLLLGIYGIFMGAK